MRSPAAAAAAVVALAAAPARAADLLTISETVLDRPTVTSLGVQVLIADDDDLDARIDLRYRAMGEAGWTEGAPLYRVRGDKVSFIAVPAQFAGSVIDLRPATTYELELHAQDADGLDMTWTVMATTRAVPGDPQPANVIAVSDADGLAAALGSATPGDVIELAEGTYAGQFSIDASGTADAPIVVRGASTDATILDGMGAQGNVIEVYASHVHIERLTIRSANRAIRFQTAGAQGNVVRRVKIEDVQLGIGAREDQLDFYICDNTLTGPLQWPQVYGDDGGMFANVDGIVVMGQGHVVCHNELIGWGDSIKTAQDGARAIDIYGNLTRSAYDNAIELDGSAGNTRAVRNLMLNSWSPLSFQPIFGGPAYAIRNVAVNLVDEQQKLHSNGVSGETVGSIVVNNTFVSPFHAINLQTSATAHDFWLLNNLYVGPAAPDGGKTISWSAPIDAGWIDYNGYYPDGEFDFDDAGTWPDFASMQAGGVFEANGKLLGADTFVSGLVGPDDYVAAVSEADVNLSESSPAVDAGLALPGLVGPIVGAGPDLGALELGCSQPIYGPRPDGVDESNLMIDCGGSGETTGGETSGGETTGSETTSGETGGATTGEEPTTGSQTSGDSPTGGAATGGAMTTGADSGAATGGDTEGSGCGCRSHGGGGLLALVLLGLRRRRR
jgi:hypothetical protein